MRPRPPCPLPSSPPPAPGGPEQELSPEQARAEARRCLNLNPCRGCELCRLLCPDQAITMDPERGSPQIDLAYCKGCGLCAFICPKGALEMVPEVE